jgi:hypothetical protein
MLKISWLNPTPHTIAVYASPPPSLATTQHSLAGGRYPLPAPVFHRQDRASFAWRTIQSFQPFAAPFPGGWRRRCRHMRAAVWFVPSAMRRTATENFRTMVVALRAPDLGGSRVRSPYHFRARIQPFQAVAAPFAGEPALQSGPSAPRPKRRSARDRRPGLAARPSPGAPRAAPRPIGCKRQQRERQKLRRNRTIGLLVQGGRKEQM